MPAESLIGVVSRSSKPIPGTSSARGSSPHSTRAAAAPAAFWRGQEHYHGRSPDGVNEQPTAALMLTMDRMHAAMNESRLTGNVDADFRRMMVTHHQSAIEMARIYLRHGRDPQLRASAETIIRTHEEELRSLQAGTTQAGAADRKP